MHHVLNTFEYKEVIVVEHLKMRDYNEEYVHVKSLFDECRYWAVKVSALNYTLSVIIESCQKKGWSTEKIVEFVYNIQGERDFEIQEGSIRFLDELFKQSIQPALSLDDRLFAAERKLYE